MKEQKGEFLSALLGTLSASLLGHVLIGNIKGNGIDRAGEGVLRAGYGIIIIIIIIITIIKRIFNTASSFN